MEIDDKKYIFDVELWIKNSSNSDFIHEMIKYNKFYIRNGADSKYDKRPIDVYMYSDNSEIFRQKIY